MLWRIWNLIIKELLAIWRDPKSRAVLIVPPMLQILLFAFAATQEVKNVPIAIFNEDSGKAAQEVIMRMEAVDAFSHIHMLKREGEIRQVIDNQDALFVLRIPQDFSRRIERGESAPLQLLLDGRRSNAAQIAQGYIAAIIGRYNEELLTLRRAPLATSFIAERTWFNPNRDAQTSTVPSLMGMLTLSTALIVTALSIAREREIGTFEQLLVTPLRPIEIVIGKMAPGLVVGLVQGTLVAVVAVWLFGIRLQGSIALLYLGLVLFLLAAIGVGLFISSLVSTQQQAMLGGMTFMMPASILSGFASPVENMPHWLQVLNWINPLAHFLVIIKGVFLRDAPFHLIAQQLWPLLTIAVFTVSAAAWMFRRKIR